MMNRSLTTTVLASIAAFALGAAPVFATRDCPPFDPPVSAATEGDEDISALPLPVRAAPRLSLVSPQPKSNDPSPASSASETSDNHEADRQTGEKAR